MMRWLGWAGGFAISLYVNVAISPEPAWLGVALGFGLSVIGYLIGTIADEVQR